VVWIVSGADLAALRADNAGLARRFFDDPETFVVGSPVEQDAVPHGYASIPTIAYASLHSFLGDVREGRIDPRVATVLYDPESWARTPAAERRRPQVAMRRFVSVARRYGYGTILAPGRDLALGGTGCRKRPGELLDAAFLRCGIAAGTRDAEMAVVQSAPEELSAGRAGRLISDVRSALATAEARPKLIATLSTSPPGSGGAVWPVDLVRMARRALGAGASGLMLNLSPSGVDLAASFLRDLERGGPLDGLAVSGHGAGSGGKAPQ
jgi:hypothetical protein